MTDLATHASDQAPLEGVLKDGYEDEWLDGAPAGAVASFDGSRHEHPDHLT